MEDEERAYRDAHFQEEMDFLKVSMVHHPSLLEQALRNAFGGGLSNPSTTFVQTRIITLQEERLGKHR